jgi:hypothetical protein
MVMLTRAFTRPALVERILTSVIRTGFLLSEECARVELTGKAVWRALNGARALGGFARSR